jgi:purine-nucleoside phosphorylase
MIFLFPKKFEFASMMLSLQSFIVNVRKPEINHYEITVMFEVERFKFSCIIVDESDIMFYAQLNQIPKEEQYVLIGSCGAISPNRILKLYQLCIITKAMKADRGYYKDNRLVVNKMKEIEMPVDHLHTMLSKFYRLSTLPIRSSNFLMESSTWFKEDEDENIIEMKFSEDTLFDMETFDCIKYFHDNNLRLLIVLRIISDIIGESQTMNRCLLNFDKYVSVLRSLIISHGKVTDRISMLSVGELLKWCHLVRCLKISDNLAYMTDNDKRIVKNFIQNVPEQFQSLYNDNILLN